MNRRASKTAFELSDESVPVHPDIGRTHPMVVFGDHRLCAGESLRVYRMPRPHMHSQVELNLVLSGGMTYWFDGQVLSVAAGGLALFWGMVPHQVVATDGPTRFACLYAPVSLFLGLPTMSRLRTAIFQGAVIAADRTYPHDPAVFLKWRDDLKSGDAVRAELARDELIARVRRLDLEGWRNLRVGARLARVASGHDADRMRTVEMMTRFIGENGRGGVTVRDVAAAAGLHPNYAMQLFRRAVGMSIKQAITRHRLDAAQSMLIASDLSVSAIAFDCGFGSLSSFYEAFQRRFGACPTKFRETIGVRAV